MLREVPADATANATNATSAASVTATPVLAPRRERKKRQTREALIHAALRLFDAKGYEHTAVREITDAVDVSERTFFRYFASKEDLALSFAKDGTDALLAALNARPAAEDPLTALRGAFRESLRVVTTDDPGGPTYLLVTKLIDSTSSLLAAYLRYMHDREDEVVRVLAEREGVDPVTDMRPRIVAAVFGSLIYLANREWRTEGGGGADAMLAAFDACVGQVGPALAGHWT
ncbi:MAG TPA: TetR family transcriptional regulator [Trebonia sp.]|jgi:AcrR family transcriptional regulator|nr:TetR family transcriptional regulator [Trebonia sp.]